MLCCGCHTIIDEPNYLIVGNQCWHTSCLKCVECKMMLEHESKCFSSRGFIFCKKDYTKYYSTTCSRCDKNIQPDEIILRAEQFVFHLNCFTCVTCNLPLHPGDTYGLIDNLIYCPHHFGNQDLYDSNLLLDDSGYYTSPNENRQSKTYQRENEEKFLNLSPKLFTSSYYIDFDETSLNKTSSLKQKRLRTSFKYHQLRCMKLYFNLNHNPDSKDLKNLSEKTNLPKRVLQVWFQNARAKYRRSNVLSKEVQTIVSSANNNNDK